MNTDKLEVMNTDVSLGGQELDGSFSSYNQCPSVVHFIEHDGTSQKITKKGLLPCDNHPL
jgi:hypothetical protein